MQYRALPALICISLVIGSLGQQNTPSLLVEEVAKDSAGSHAGIQPGDRLTSYNNRPIESPAALDAMQQNTFGRRDVALKIRRGQLTLSLTVPLGQLGIQVRPELSGGAERLYQGGEALLKTGETKKALAQWQAAAKLTLVQNKVARAWLWGRVGETLESEAEWKEAREAHLAAWEIVKTSSDAAAQSRTLSGLGRCSQIRTISPRLRSGSSKPAGWT